ncbi:hypothetical protein [Rickettsia oklahomensis]|uniref:Uncharacterized protein n=1 Tax=Rickettsia oklahomensis TaxID=3141789 RepID=A0AAU7BY55_9RICK
MSSYHDKSAVLDSTSLIIVLAGEKGQEKINVLPATIHYRLSTINITAMVNS